MTLTNDTPGFSVETPGLLCTIGYDLVSANLGELPAGSHEIDLVIDYTSGRETSIYVLTRLSSGVYIRNDADSTFASMSWRTPLASGKSDSLDAFVVVRGYKSPASPNGNPSLLNAIVFGGGPTSSESLPWSKVTGPSIRSNDVILNATGGMNLLGSSPK